jgi:hypothetical protein
MNRMGVRASGQATAVTAAPAWLARARYTCAQWQALSYGAKSALVTGLGAFSYFPAGTTIDQIVNQTDAACAVAPAVTSTTTVPGGLILTVSTSDGSALPVDLAVLVDGGYDPGAGTPGPAVGSQTFRMTNLLAGSHQVAVTGTGFQPSQSSVSVQSGQMAPLAVQLQPCNPPTNLTSQSDIDAWNAANPSCPPIPPLPSTGPAWHPALNMGGFGAGPVPPATPGSPPTSTPAATSPTCNALLISFLLANPAYGVVTGTMAQPTQAGLNAFLAANPSCATDPMIQYYEQQLNPAPASTGWTTGEIVMGVGAAALLFWALKD